MEQLFYGSVLLVILGGLWLLVAAFRTGFWWGIGCVVFAPVQLVFVVRHWAAARLSVGIQTVGALLMLLAVIQGGPALQHELGRSFAGLLKQTAPELYGQWQAIEAIEAIPVADEQARYEAMDELMHQYEPDKWQRLHASNAVRVAAHDREAAINAAREQPVPAATPAAEASTIYKCKDAQGHISYTEQPCPEAGAQLKTLPVLNTQPGQ